MTELINADELQKAKGSGSTGRKLVTAVGLTLTNHDLWQKKIDETLVKGATAIKFAPKLRSLLEALNGEDTKALTDNIREAVVCYARAIFQVFHGSLTWRF